MPTYQATYSMPEAAAHAPQFQLRNYENFRVIPNSGALGAEVEGIDLRGLGDSAFAEIEQALADHLVLFIRDQDLDPKGQVAFAERFGPLMQYRYVEPMPGHPMISELLTEPGDIYNFGGTWHSDTPQLERPPMITMLYAVECPPVGGDTSYANQYMAWDTLSDDMRRMLESVQVVHSAALSFAGHYGSEEVQGKSTMQSAYASDLAIETAHPVGRTHPVTGRKALYVCDAYAAHFVGMSQEESLPLLRYLWAHSIQPDFTCRFHWRPGTLAVWDNRSCLHYAHNDYPGQRRLMHRIIIEGERPY